jgi:hypothetical protein
MVPEDRVSWLGRGGGARYSPYSFRFYVESTFPRYVRLPHPAQLCLGEKCRDVSWGEIARVLNRQLLPSSRFSELEGINRVPGYETLARPPEATPSDQFRDQVIRAFEEVTDDTASTIVGIQTAWGGFLPELDTIPSYSFLWGDVAFERVGLAEVADLRIFPTLWWPEDHSWLMLTPMDRTSSLIGCDARTLSALDANGVELWEVDPTAPVLS